jgi:glycosyltransferase involved in cell wall biosynthesis
MNKEQINNFLNHENYYSDDNILINNPKPIYGQKEPSVSYFYDTDEKVEYSVVIPVHNQEQIIVTNIQSIINNIVGNYEIILIFDNCSDDSEKNIIEYFSNFNFDGSGLKRVICINQPSPIFETSCDNIGFRLSKGEYIIEIQADMKMMTFGFNFILSKPFRLFEDVFSVSGRCAHNFPFDGNGVGKLGELVEKPINFDFSYMNKYFVMQTCNRGPILFSNERLKEMGYLDELNFVLADDDHDINIRAFSKNNWVSGHVPVEFYSPISHGTTRKQMDSINKEYLDKRLSNRVNPFLYSYRHPVSKLEIRDLDKNINYRH